MGAEGLGGVGHLHSQDNYYKCMSPYLTSMCLMDQLGMSAQKGVGEWEREGSEGGKEESSGRN